MAMMSPLRQRMIGDIRQRHEVCGLGTRPTARPRARPACLVSDGVDAPTLRHCRARMAALKPF